MNTISKFALATVLVLCGFAHRSNATITINFFAGDLMNKTGAPVPLGGLLELVADTANNGFTAPTANAFVSNDYIVVASFSLNGNLNGGGNPGQTANVLTFSPTNLSGLDAGDPLLFRWFPSLTTSSSAPGAGTMYGQFRTVTSQDGSTLPTPWSEPADGQSYTLSFITQSAGGSNPNAVGYAVTPIIPEPSTPLMLGGSMSVLLILKRRTRQSAAV